MDKDIEALIREEKHNRLGGKPVESAKLCRKISELVFSRNGLTEAVDIVVNLAKKRAQSKGSKIALVEFILPKVDEFESTITESSSQKDKELLSLYLKSLCRITKGQIFLDATYIRLVFRYADSLLLLDEDIESIAKITREATPEASANLPRAEKLFLVLRQCEMCRKAGDNIRARILLDKLKDSQLEVKKDDKDKAMVTLVASFLHHARAELCQINNDFKGACLAHISRANALISLEALEKQPSSPKEEEEEETIGSTKKEEEEESVTQSVLSYDFKFDRTLKEHELLSRHYSSIPRPEYPYIGMLNLLSTPPKPGLKTIDPSPESLPSIFAVESLINAVICAAVLSYSDKQDYIKQICDIIGIDDFENTLVVSPWKKALPPIVIQFIKHLRGTSIICLPVYYGSSSAHQFFSSFSPLVNDDDGKLWGILERRLLEYNVINIGKICGLMKLSHVSESMGVSDEVLERVLASKDVSVVLRSKMDMFLGIVMFREEKKESEVMEDWSQRNEEFYKMIHQLSRLIELEKSKEE
ncbi:putative multi-domain containing protein [Aduncisulcus paluster]|uniref:Multi-domain containing protein n=1 Tax=Aduncisulcus paluster TaxID=2918883 RepID=A0ABQ5KS90_9EUKA|nr:putative multi-domain containing protein [Aduncisulcus paluster]|eukprot:gnl/Carplike_NY0171/2317_a3124_638.p1 GENE.gnl/Carplike_NY0171/2317_a3124_638~~gnl/Carplike_NY0171/2317_a3124_638.p1  ORF type:complete len:542 (+),score=137.49 gnl/Carplike_NY0171/2317_a3124_638:34-1626(+)